MAVTPILVPVEKREEFGKGASRRLRREGRIPGVLYEAGIDNVHFSVDRIEISAIVRNEGVNAILSSSTRARSCCAWSSTSIRTS